MAEKKRQDELVERQRIVCLEHRLSVIIRKPYGERQKRTEYNPHIFL